MKIGEFILYPHKFADRKSRLLLELHSGRNLWYVPDHFELRQGHNTVAVFSAEADLTCSSPFVEYVVLGRGQRMLLANDYGVSTYTLDLKDGRINSGVILERGQFDDPGLYRTSFVEAGDYVLFVYEGGVICFDNSGQMLWRQIHKTWDLYLTEVRDAVVWYESEFEGKWGYKLVDGTRIEVS